MTEAKDRDAAHNAPQSQLGAMDQAQTIWNQTEITLRRRLGERVHSSWTGQLQLSHVDEHSVYLTTPSKFVAGRIESRYGDLVRAIWMQNDARSVYITAESEAKAQAAKPQSRSAAVPTANIQTTAPRFEAARAPDQRPITPFAPAPDSMVKSYTFENFVVGSSNELAYAVARRVVTGELQGYNPVVIHGPHGMGKSHLLHAIKEKALSENPGRRVKLVPAETFVAGFVQSVRASGRAEIEKFKASLRDVDLLIIDDAHFIADKPGSQEELLHTLISLVQAGRQILLATDRHPHAIDKASARLKSYLCGGLLCDIGPADYELRLRILERLIEKRRQNGNPMLAMPQDARNHLAAKSNATPRDIEGAFNQVVARSQFLGSPLTLETVQEALAHSRYTAALKPSVERIQKTIAEYYSLSLDDLLSKRRARIIARPRQIAMYICKRLTSRSLPDIGRRFGGRDHTTVIHAVKRIESLMQDDDDIRRDVEQLIESLTLGS